MEKKLSEITRSEWIAIRWIEVTELGSERTFLANDRRTPDEAMQALSDWDETETFRDETEARGEVPE